MAEVQMTRQFPVEPQKLYDYLVEPTNWPKFYANLVDAEAGSWSRAGDTVKCKYRLLGRKLDAIARLDSVEPAQEVRFSAIVEGLPDTKQHWQYRDDGDGSTEITVTLSTGETTNWFGKAIDRIVVPRALERDLSRTLDAIEELAPIELT